MENRRWKMNRYGVWAVGIILCAMYGLSFAEGFVYSGKGKRDPFVPLVGAGAAYYVKDALEITSAQDVVLEGILYDEKGDSRAIVNGLILKEGEQAGIVTVEKIEAKKVSLIIEGNRFEVNLGGEKGGEEQ
jgi:hypothetical protein